MWLVALLIGGSEALAQGWPAKTVRIVVPFAPGGTADTLGRLVSQRLSETLKENFIVENRAGAGGVIGSGPLPKAAPDGYTPGVAGVPPHFIRAALLEHIPFHPLREFTHLSFLCGPPWV